MESYYKSDMAVIYHADCRDVMREMSNVDLIITDPPYGIGLRYDIYDDTESAWFAMMNEVIPMMRRFSIMAIMPVCRQQALKWYYDHHAPDWLISWYKGSPGHRSFVGFNDWEAHIVWGKNKDVSMHDHFQCSNNEQMGNYGHPCPKPISWALWLISNAIGNGSTVFDPFMGSGTTLVAAAKLGIKSIGSDISERYCEIAANRLEHEGSLWTTRDNLSPDDLSVINTNGSALRIFNNIVKLPDVNQPSLFDFF